MSYFAFTAALDGARTLASIDEIARDLWSAYGAGVIAEGEAENLSARIEEARQRLRPNAVGAIRPLAAPPRSSIFPARKRRCVSPDRAKSRERRRRLAYSGVMPPALATGFTPGQLATLRIVADEVRAKGSCQLCLAEIAARAGVGVTTARDAIRLAAGDGLLTITERRRRGMRNLPNFVAIVSREWRAWLAHGRRGGSKNTNPTGISSKFEGIQSSRTGVNLANENTAVTTSDPPIHEDRIHSTQRCHFHAIG